MIRLFVSDLDGTLLNANKQIDTQDRVIMGSLMKSGVERCLASGRLRKDMVRVAEDLGGPFHFICQNGAHIETADGQILAQHAFTSHLAGAVYQLISSYDALSVACLPDVDIITQRTEKARAVEARLFAPYQTVANLSERIGHDILPTKFSIFGEDTVLIRLEKTLRAIFAQQISTFRSDADCLDVMPASVSKGAGLRDLMAKFHLQGDEVACVGDSFNDLSMFTEAQFSFAMHHALPEILKHASRVTPSVWEAGLTVLQHNEKATL